MSKVIRLLIVVGLFANQFLAPLQAAKAVAAAEMAAASLETLPIGEVIQGLHSFAGHLDSLGYFGILADPIY